MQKLEKKYLTIKEAAYIYGFSPRRLRDYCLLGKIPGAVKPKGTKEWRIPVDAMERFFQSSRRK